MFGLATDNGSKAFNSVTAEREGKGNLMKRFSVIGMSAIVALAAGQALSAPVTANLTPLYTTTDSPANHVAASGGFLDGVGDFIINGSSRCSSALLGDGLHVLTAAHCLTDLSGNNTFNNGTISFFGDNGTYAHSVDEVFINAGWNGQFGNGNDIAVVRLDNVVDSEITRYDIYRDTDEVGQVGDKAGFGRSGTGLTGSTLSSGTKRTVQNRYDLAGMSLFGGISSDILLYDFDNGNAANDAIGALAGFLPPSPFVVDPIGVGITEGISAPGDSGGPTFIGNMIAGVTSFGLNYFFADGSSPDIDGGPGQQVNSTFGEIAGDTRVSSFAGFIDGFVSTPPVQGVPAPLSGVLLLTGIIGLVRFRQSA